jgi:hypothetical protein
VAGHTDDEYKKLVLKSFHYTDVWFAPLQNKTQEQYGGSYYCPHNIIKV